MLNNTLQNIIKSVTSEPAGSPNTGTCMSTPGSADVNGQHASRSLLQSSACISILLVDDEPALLDLGRIYLEQIPGFSVTTACSAAAALGLLKTSGFDAIVSDYQMPDMDGIAFLQEIRSHSLTQPFILFTGKGRAEVVIEALNSGADFYVQKGGDPIPQYAELAHKVRRAVDGRRSTIALKQKHAVLRAILAASPYGIGYVRNRTFQWVNESLAGMLGYSRQDLKGRHLRELYENQEVYEEIGNRIQQDLKRDGKCRIFTRFSHRKGFSLDTEIHIAPLDSGNLHLGHMILMSDISKKIAAVKDLKNPAGIPHLELTPVIETDRNGRILYYNDAAIDAMVRYGSRGTLEEFFPADFKTILSGMDEADTGSIFRDVRLGPVTFRLHITLSRQFRVARLSAVIGGSQ